MNNDKTLIFHFSRSVLKAALLIPLMLSLTACDGLARFIAKPESKPTEPVAAEQPPSVPEAEKKPVEKTKLKPSPLYSWNGDGRQVTRIVVNTDQQKAHFYEGDEEIGWSTVATGVSKYPTPTGQFTVIEKVENKKSNLYGKVFGKGGKVIKSSVKVGRDPIPAGARFEGSSMPFFMRLTHDGVGLHAGPIPHPGKPASHGCIRMPSKIAPVLFNHVTNGTQVAIVGQGPDYGDYLARQRAIAAKQATERRRINSKKSARTASTPQVAASTQPASAVTTAPATPPSMVSSGEMIEAQAEAKDMTAPLQPTEVSSSSETILRTEQPQSAVAEQAGTTPNQSPATATPATDVIPVPTATVVTPPVVPSPAQATSAPISPTIPAPPVQPTVTPTEPVNPSSSVPTSPAPVMPTSPPPLAQPSPVSPAPAQPAPKTESVTVPPPPNTQPSSTASAPPTPAADTPENKAE